MSSLATPYRGFHSLTIRTEPYGELQRRHGENMRAGRCARASANMSPASSGTCSKPTTSSAATAPFLKLTALEGDTVILRDRKQDRLVEVFVKNGALHCRLDESSECYRVGYCSTLPEVCKILAEWGLKTQPARKRR